MSTARDSFLTRLWWALPWLLRYPAWRARELAGRLVATDDTSHLILVVANHFEPGWTENGSPLDERAQLARVEEWCRQARAIGGAVRDADGAAFRHTYFYPAEQYHASLLEKLSELQADGFGEVEIHLHHGVESPDTESNLRRTLVEFRDILADRHRCLARWNGTGLPMYAFVHGNLALGNSAGGRYCGVDSELEVLAETGCYADLTLPSAPDRSQVPRINAIYECGRPLDQRRPHRSGPGLRIGKAPRLPILLTGPLVFSWRGRVCGLPRPQLDIGALDVKQMSDLARLQRWRSAQIHVQGRPDWVFVKLFCHGFFPGDQNASMGEPIRRFLDDVIAVGERSGAFKIHFATAREAVNIALAAIDRQGGSPGQYRNYRLHSIGSATEPCSTVGTLSTWNSSHLEVRSSSAGDVQ